MVDKWLRRVGIGVLLICAALWVALFVMGKKTDVAPTVPYKPAYNQAPGVKPEAPKYLPDLSAAARAICKEFVTRSLHDPDRAQWDAPWDWSTTNEGAGQYTVGVKVRAPNAYGAMTKSYMVCSVANTSGDNWRLVSMQRMQ